MMFDAELLVRMLPIVTLCANLLNLVTWLVRRSELKSVCARQLNLDHLCRLNFDQGSSAVREAGGCG